MSRMTAFLALAAIGLPAAACSYSTTTAETAPAPARTAVVAPAGTTTATYYAPATVPAPVSTTTIVPAATPPPAGQQAFRDEYGFRYDGQGNRLDARGNIISPQSTRP